MWSVDRHLEQEKKAVIMDGAMQADEVRIILESQRSALPFSVGGMRRRYASYAVLLHGSSELTC